MSTRPHALRAAAAFTGALALFGLSLPVAASAESLDVPDSGYLTIHSLQQGDTDLGEADGSLIEDLNGATPIDGVSYDIHKVTGVDLTTNSGWQQAALNETNFVAGDTSTYPAVDTSASVYLYDEEEPVVTVTTHINEEGTDSSVSVWGETGQYLVTPSPLTADQIAAGYWLAEPFLVTIPMPGENQSVYFGSNEGEINVSTWNTDIHVYPKNERAGLSLAISDTTSTDRRENINYTFTAALPVGGTDAYKIVDVLDKQLINVYPETVTIDGTELEQGVDWEYTNVENGDGTHTVTISLLAPGLELAKNSTTHTLTASVSATAITDNDGDISTNLDDVNNSSILNSGVLYASQSAIDAGTPASSNEVEYRRGSLTVNKVDGSGKPITSDGAEFAIFASKEDAVTASRDVSWNTVLSRSLAVDLTSGYHPGLLDDSITGFDEGFGTVDGTATLTGLTASDFANGSPVTAGTCQDYCTVPELTYWLVETKAPDGYVLQAEPVEVEIAGGETTTVTITNYTSGGTLPLTGGAGTWLLIASGLGVAAIGAGLLIRAQRRAHIG
ncbi:SpaH/EbpB family LPXTG-anchored major pilin [Pseudoclavibacter soli]|uniref:SpaH/EbpB family LPXTG-anchored major pilin n=1 Tax=Pseudoclavibacter soli TaxID=452623 RepID=UPI00041E0CF3|nr:SpaH/EbpB family LPXTG-anchored major pilin [Pseudoclavibacter soli]